MDSRVLEKSLIMREGKRDSLDHSGGNFDNCIDMKFSGTNSYYTVLRHFFTTKFQVNTIVKVPTTMVRCIQFPFTTDNNSNASILAH